VDDVWREAGEKGEATDGETMVMGRLENVDALGLRKIAKHLSVRYLILIEQELPQLLFG